MKRYMEHVFTFNSGKSETYLLSIAKEYEEKSDKELNDVFTESIVNEILKPMFASSDNGQYNFVDKDGYFTLIRLSDVSRFSFKIVWLEE